MKDISVIIPVYNDCKNISKCVSSVQNNATNSNYEIICVDDGSVDDSLKILTELSHKHNNIIVLSQEHRGLSAARNAGLKVATGKYIYFVDSDDLVTNHIIDKAFQICEKRKLNILFFSFENFTLQKDLYNQYQSKLATKKRTHLYKEQVLTGKELHSLLWEYNEYYPMVWLQIIRRDWLIRQGIVFEEGLIYEDNLYTFRVLYYAKRTMCISEIGYKKQIRKDSITTAKESIESVYAFLYTYIHMLSEIQIFTDPYEVFEQQRAFSQNQPSFGLMLEDIKKTMFRRYYRLNDDEKNNLSKKCTDFEKIVLRLLIEQSSSADSIFFK